MISNPERPFNIRGYHEQQELHRLASLFRREYVLGYVTDSLGYITRTETEQLAQQLYLDAVADGTRPISTVLQDVGLTRESERLRYLRSFLGKLDQMFHVTLRSTGGHDVLMSGVALYYDRAEMEERLDLVPRAGKPHLRAADVLAGEGPIRPLMLDFCRLESVGCVNIVRTNEQQVVLPTASMDDMAESLEDLANLYEIQRRGLFLIAGRDETRVLVRS